MESMEGDKVNLAIGYFLFWIVAVVAFAFIARVAGSLRGDEYSKDKFIRIVMVAVIIPFYAFFILLFFSSIVWLTDRMGTSIFDLPIMRNLSFNSIIALCFIGGFVCSMHYVLGENIKKEKDG